MPKESGWVGGAEVTNSRASLRFGGAPKCPDCGMDMEHQFDYYGEAHGEEVVKKAQYKCPRCEKLESVEKEERAAR